MLDYRVGDATDIALLGVPEPTIIAHICNDQGGWGMGFVRAVSARWPGPEMEYRKLGREGGLILGHVQFVPVGWPVVVANMIAQRMYKSNDNPVPVRRWALMECLQRVAMYALVGNYRVMMPRIATGLGGMTWENVEPLIIECLCTRGVRVTVVDLEEPA